MKRSFLRSGPKEVREDNQEKTKFLQDAKVSVLGWSLRNHIRYKHGCVGGVGPESLPDRS